MLPSCAQIVDDAKIATEQCGMSPHEWRLMRRKVHLFWNVNDAEGFARHLFGDKVAHTEAWAELNRKGLYRAFTGFAPARVGRAWLVWFRESI